MQWSLRMFLAGMVILSPTFQSVGVVVASEPNILLVLGDDMTWRDCQPYGNEDVHTPHMDQLAREGVL